MSSAAVEEETTWGISKMDQSPRRRHDEDLSALLERVRELTKALQGDTGQERDAQAKDVKKTRRKRT